MSTTYLRVFTGVGALDPVVAACASDDGDGKDAVPAAVTSTQEPDSTPDPEIEPAGDESAKDEPGVSEPPAEQPLEDEPAGPPHVGAIVWTLPENQ